MKKDGKGVPRIVFARVGGIEKAEDFLAFLIRETGLEGEKAMKKRWVVAAVLLVLGMPVFAFGISDV
jgi:hypothetical protein